MPGTSKRRARASILGVTGVATLAATLFSVYPAGASSQAVKAGVGAHAADAFSPAELGAYGYERTAPGLSVSGQALASAEAQAAQMSSVGGSWTQLTTNPDNGQPAGYNDLVWSNIGAGFRNVSGRVTALASQGHTLYLGAADGGVWKSTNKGTTWTPIGDKLPTLSVGALAVNPADNSLWVGLGEANTNADSYAGQGVFRSAHGNASWARVGGTELSGFTMYKVLFDGVGHVYAATNHGLWRRSASDLTSAWTQVFQPDASTTPYNTTFVTDVVTVPGSNGTKVLLADGWRGGTSAADTAKNGFYLSTTGGTLNSFKELSPTGAPPFSASDIGRTTFAYSATGSKLYAVVESSSLLNLQGVFVSSSGDPAGPWTPIADSNSLCNSGSACKTAVPPGVQAWYNQYLIVDPANADHVILGLEETFQSFNGGSTWTTINPYWNLSFACDFPLDTPTCPPVTHPDQHAVMIVGGTLYIGNDGGVYSRPLEDTAPMGDWTDLNNTLHTLQYYDAQAGAVRDAEAKAQAQAQGHGGNSVAVWGGLQDNGTTVSYPGAAQTITPAGGDGGYVIVNPNNAQDMLGEYVNLNTYMTTDGGHNFSTVSPACAVIVGVKITGCDPGPRFIAPLATDVNNPNHWVIGGEYVWSDTEAWSTVCHGTIPASPGPPPTPAIPQRCDWTNVHDTGKNPNGTPHSITAIAVNGKTIYAAWCGGGCNPGGATAFSSGIDTNYGGTWHTISASNLPNRFIQGLTVDSDHPGHVFAIYNGYSRRWIPGGGVGHVFESRNGGASFTDISGNLPDVPSDALVYANDKLALGTDIGAFIANAGDGSSTHWSRLGTNLPNTSLNNLRLNPDGETLLAATHGRGLWTFRLSNNNQ